MDETRRKCFKCGCSPAEHNIKLFRFPKPGVRNLIRCLLWAKYIFPEGQYNSLQNQTKLFTDHRMLCEKHFKDTDFKDLTKKQLLRTAVPCDETQLFSEDDNSEQSTLNYSLSAENISELPKKDINEATLNYPLSADNISELPKKNTNEATLQPDPPDSQSTFNNHSTQADHQYAKPKLVRKKKENDENSVVNALQCLENIAEVINTTPQQPTVPTQDKFYLFGLSVAAQLRNLPSHIAIDAQSKIQNTLSTARISSIISISNTPAPSSSYNYNPSISDQPLYIVTESIAQDTTNAQNVGTET